jgi:hypothetical protein
MGPVPRVWFCFISEFRTFVGSTWRILRFGMDCTVSGMKLGIRGKETNKLQSIPNFLEKDSQEEEDTDVLHLIGTDIVTHFTGQPILPSV